MKGFVWVGGKGGGVVLLFFALFVLLFYALFLFLCNFLPLLAITEVCTFCPTKSWEGGSSMM